MSFPFRTELVVENTIFGTQQAVWKERLCCKSVLEDNIQTVVLPPAEFSDCFELDFISNLPNDKRVEELCDYLLENYIEADSSFPPPVWSECSASSLGTINACESFHAHLNALFYSASPSTFVPVSALLKIQNETCIKMRSVTRQRLKKSATVKKGTSSPPK